MADLQTNAANPAEVQTNGVRVRQHSLSEQIAYDQYTRGIDAVNDPPPSRRGPMGVFVQRISPPGIV